MDQADCRPEAIDQQRWELLEQVEDASETPMLVLGFVWLVLLIVDLVRGLGPLLSTVSTGIWIVFILDFIVRLVLAPRKLNYLKANWITALALMVPALRLLRIVRLVRVLQVARTARGLQLFRMMSSLNRGMRALRATMGRRGFGFIALLTTIVTFVGAAGMYAFEQGAAGGLKTYGSALWWTAMLMTSIGSEYWPKTAEGRLLCFLLSVYGFVVFGYMTATLATFFIDRDADSKDSHVPNQQSIDALREEISALREEIRALYGRRAA